ELCLSLFGMTRPDSGESLINGQPGRLLSIQDDIRAGIGYVTENRMSRGMGMSQSIEINIIGTVFHKVKGSCGLLSDSKAQQLVPRMVNARTIKAPDTHLPVNTLS
ncbi:sugar ABC transporter ATP-binding protein, partial [Klebsiella pneumoniae]